MNRYSLANYILSIDCNSDEIKNMFGTISIGGEGSYTDSITIGGLPNLWDTTGFSTGAWVHNKNLSKTGTATVSISQLSDKVKKFIKMCNVYYSGDYDGLTLSLSDTQGNKVCSCIDCYIQKIPDQAFGNTAANQSWIFTCGQINFN